MVDGSRRLSARERLRQALASALAKPDVQPHSLTGLERAAAEWPARGVAAAALSLPDPRVALPLLRRLLGHENWLTAIEAAAALALLGERDGLAVLQGPQRGGTNSNIECFFIHAALLLLGEPLGPGERARSVFAHYEALLDDAIAEELA